MAMAAWYDGLLCMRHRCLLVLVLGVVSPLSCSRTAERAIDGAAGAPDATAGAGGDSSGGAAGAGGVAGVGGAAGSAPMAEPIPTIPIGWDAFRQWDRLPILRLATRTSMRSTFDRSGGNEAADASHFLRVEESGLAIPLDVQGPGVLAFVRTNHWHGSPWHYRVDGTDHVVAETNTAHPDAPTTPASFVPEGAFPAPLAVTWAATRGADLSWIPIPYVSSFSLGYERTHYGTGYYVFHSFPEGADHLSQPLAAWTAAPPPSDVVALIASSGADLSPPSAATYAGSIDLQPGAASSLGPLSPGATVIRKLALDVPRESALALADATLRITWDDAASPSIEAPVALFFGAGTLVNRDDAEWLVRSLVSSIRFDAKTVHLATYLPMPYFTKAHVELVGGSAPVPGLGWTIRTVPLGEPARFVAPLHATYRDHGAPTPGRDLSFLDTNEVEGGGPFCGTLVGTSFTFTDQAALGTLEGDPRFFFDDSETPQAQGTGTEEWGGGGDYWEGGKTTTLPFAGHPVGAPSLAAAKSPLDAVHSAYRFLVSDAMPFGRRARIGLEHGGGDESNEHYRSVTYWYGKRGACLVPTDTVDIGDPADEALHAYSSPSASAVETITSRYDVGVDAIGGKEVVPTTTETGRRMTGTTEVTLAIAPENQGVLLRRKLDQSIVDQRADVFVARDGSNTFVRAGTWYVAGSNRAVYANADSETGAPVLVPQSSNRRFRDDELLIARTLTAGASSLRVRIVSIGAPQPLVPGEPAPQAGWSELRYSAYSWVLPP